MVKEWGRNGSSLTHKLASHVPWVIAENHRQHSISTMAWAMHLTGTNLVLLLHKRAWYSEAARKGETTEM
jgi:hypothetical protein